MVKNNKNKYKRKITYSRLSAYYWGTILVYQPTLSANGQGGRKYYPHFADKAKLT